MIVDTSIVFGLASLTFAGVKDVVLKRQATRCSGSGTYIAIVGTVWMLFFSLFGLSQGSLPVHSVLKLGLIAGTFSVSADYLLIRSLRDLDAGFAVTIYRLNLVPAALMAVILLAEPFSLLKAFGLIAGVIAVILFCRNSPVLS